MSAADGLRDVARLPERSVAELQTLVKDLRDHASAAYTGAWIYKEGLVDFAWTVAAPQLQNVADAIEAERDALIAERDQLREKLESLAAHAMRREP